MVGRYFSIAITALIVYAIMAWPMFVLGIYSRHLRGVAKHSPIRHLVTSWLLVIAGFLLLFGIYLADKPPPGVYRPKTAPNSPKELVIMVIVGVVTAVSALPAGAAYSMLEKRQWRTLIPPVTGIISQAFFYTTILLA